MGVIVLFAVVNTMTMNVMERTNEIGTIRAMGVRRSGIRLQFTGDNGGVGGFGRFGGGAGGGRFRGGLNPRALTACMGKAVGDAVQLDTPGGPVPAICTLVARPSAPPPAP